MIASAVWEKASTHPRRPRVALALGTAVLLVLGAASYEAAGATVATINLKPDVGPPTYPFMVRGRGFGSSEVVAITFDSISLGTAATGPNGSFSKAVRVPASAIPGDHSVTATGETSGESAQATFLVRTNWPRFHFDSANTGFNPYENVLSPANVGTLVQKWAVPTVGGGAPDPIVAYGRVYVAPNDGVVRALDPVTGGLLWSFDTGASMSGIAPTASGNLIYAGNDAGVIYALSAATGLPVWNRDLGNAVYGSPVTAGAAVFIGVDNKMYSLDAATGEKNWAMGAITGQSPTAAFGLVFNEGSLGCALEGLNAATGDELWFVSFCSEGEASVTVPAADGLVFDVSVGVHGMKADTGEILWTTYVGSYGPASVANGLVYLPDATGFLTALNETSGTIRWRALITDPSTYSSPAVANDVLYLGCEGGFLRAYNARNGADLWASPAAPSDFDSSPAVSDGVVYASTADGTVYAFGLP